MIEQTRNIEQEALVALGGFMGLRVSESLGFCTHHLDLDSMLATIRGKGDKTRVIPVSSQAWTHIAPAYAMAMSKPDHRLVSYQDRFARQIITNLARRANLKREVTSHDLRATFATAAYDKTRDIRAVQELLGHASSETTEIYTGVLMENLRKAVDFS